jgi:hypothetical protein
MSHMSQPNNTPTEIWRVRHVRTWHTAEGEERTGEFCRYYWTRDGAISYGLSRVLIEMLGVPQVFMNGTRTTYLERASISGFVDG